MRALGLFSLVVLGIFFGVHTGHALPAEAPPADPRLELLALLTVLWFLVSGAHKVLMLVHGSGSRIVAGIAIAVVVVLVTAIATNALFGAPFPRAAVVEETCGYATMALIVIWTLADLIGFFVRDDA